MGQIAAYAIQKGHGDPLVALQILQGVQEGLPPDTQQALQLNFALALKAAGVLDRPHAGSGTGQSAAVAYFRDMLNQSVRLSPAQLKAILPGAGRMADLYAPLLVRAMAENGIDTPFRRAAFLAQLGAESQNLQKVEEGLYYTSANRLDSLLSTFANAKQAEPYLRNPEKLANRIYANRNGNGDERSGDGWRFRGRGLIQITGRSNYRDTGYENNPDAVVVPRHAALSAARYWRVRGFNKLSMRELSHSRFYSVVGKVDAGHLEFNARWKAYQRALDVLGGRSTKP